MNDEQRPSGSRKNEQRDDKEKEDREPKEPMEQDPDQARRDVDKASVGIASSLDYKFLDEDEEGTEKLAGTTEPAPDETSTLDPPSAFMNAAPNLPESSSPGKIETTKQLLTDSQRRRKMKGAARVTFLKTLRKEEWEVHHRDHENRTGCLMDRVAFMEEVSTVMQFYGTQSLPKTSLTRPLMREIPDNWTNAKGE